MKLLHVAADGIKFIQDLRRSNEQRYTRISVKKELFYIIPVFAKCFKTVTWKINKEAKIRAYFLLTGGLGF